MDKHFDIQLSAGQFVLLFYMGLEKSCELLNNNQIFEMICEPELKCKYSGHQGSRINGVCINNGCNKVRPFCINCKREFHTQHPDGLLDFDELKKWIQEGTSFSKVLNSTLLEIEQLAQVLKEIIKNCQISNNLNICHSTTDEIEKEVERILKIKFYSKILSKDLSQITGQIQQIKNNYEHELLTQKKKVEISIAQSQQLLQQQSEVIFCQEQLQQQIIKQKQFQVKPQGIDKALKNILFKFSKLDKNNDVKVSQQGNVAEGKANLLGLCICEPAILKHAVTRIAFKVVKIAYNLYIGLCQKEIIRQANYASDLSYVGHGSYLIRDDGYSYSHHQEEMNHKKQMLKFFPNEIIIVEVDIGNNEIIWTKKLSNEKFTMKFNIQKELNFSVGFFGFEGGSVEIIHGI